MTVELLFDINAHKDWVQSVVWTPDSQQLASASDDKKIKFWDSPNLFDELFTPNWKTPLLRLINASTGRLCNRDAQINAFTKSTKYKEISYSFDVHGPLQTGLIKEAVAKYFSWVMLSHTHSSPVKTGTGKICKNLIGSIKRRKERKPGEAIGGGEDSSGQRKIKRAKLERDQSDAGGSRSPLLKTYGTRQILATGPSDSACSSHSYQSDVPPPSSKAASTFSISSLPSRSDILPVLAFQRNSPDTTLPPISSQLPPSSQSLASSSQQVVTPKPPSGPKQVLKHKSVSPIFGSLSPTHDPSTPLKMKNGRRALHVIVMVQVQLSLLLTIAR
ncbi:hypothetical protein BDR07DRAFT_1484669 [Suillus spraguei]|nr:hypothetical protein BDR07DRAFT_1484669 [Suillus spraguei]